jgi:hypothetical protein
MARRILDSVLGTIVAAVLIGTIESLGATYPDPQLGGGFGAITSYLRLLATLIIRPHGLFGRPPVHPRRHTTIRTVTSPLDRLAPLIERTPRPEA